MKHIQLFDKRPGKETLLNPEPAAHTPVNRNFVANDAVEPNPTNNEAEATEGTAESIERDLVQHEAVPSVGESEYLILHIRIVDV